MSLDPELKRKLAKAARELAAELEAGTAPKLGVGMHFNPDGTPCCAMGHVYARAGVPTVRTDDLDHPVIVAGSGSGIPHHVALVALPVENANDSLAPWLKDATASTRTPLPTALREYALAVEGL